MTIYPNLIIEALKNVRYPGTGQHSYRWYECHLLVIIREAE